MVEFFCFTCKLPICTVCALSNHKNCVYEELSIAVSALKEKFDNLKPAFNRKAYNLKKMTATLDTGVKQIEGDFGHSMANVGDITDRIMRQLRQRESALNLQIEDHVSTMLYVICVIGILSIACKDTFSMKIALLISILY